jgi:hypothetical protein
VLLRSLIYTSVASAGLSDEAVVDIHNSARAFNGLDGISGLLVFNGERFLQIIEGSEDAIEDLLRRLRADPRHTEVTVVEDRPIEKRSFSGWQMALARVSRGPFEPRDDIDKLLPETVSAEIRESVLGMVDRLAA